MLCHKEHIWLEKTKQNKQIRKETQGPLSNLPSFYSDIHYYKIISAQILYKLSQTILKNKSYTDK